MDQLPRHLLDQIVERLPTKSLVRFRCASKEVYGDPLIESRVKKLVEEPKIVLLDDYLQDFQLCGHDLSPRFQHKEDVDIIEASIPELVLSCSSGARFLGSCNGLMCFLQADRWGILLVNPVLKEVLPLPISPGPEEHNRSLLMSRSWSAAWCRRRWLDFAFGMNKEWSATGLGLDQVTGLYKFVVISRETGPKVFDLCTRQWRRIKSRPESIPQGAGIFIGGVIYWRPSGYYDHCKMVSFDVAKEEFSLLLCPQHPSTLFDLEDRLGLVYIDQAAGHVHIWELNVDFPKEWTKKYEIDSILLQRCICRTHDLDNEFYILGTWNRKIVYKVDHLLCSYDPVSREVECVHPGLFSILVHKREPRVSFPIR